MYGSLCICTHYFSAAGQVVVDTSLPLRSNNYSKILSVKPIAVSASQRVQFLVKGNNLARPATRFLLAILERMFLASYDVKFDFIVVCGWFLCRYLL